MGATTQTTPGEWLYGDWMHNKVGVESDTGWVEVWVREEDGSKSLPFVACKHIDAFANARLVASAPDLLGDLREAAATLRRYEVLHRAKGTTDSDAKAEVNASLAARFEATIAKATGEPSP